MSQEIAASSGATSKKKHGVWSAVSSAVGTIIVLSLAALAIVFVVVPKMTGGMTLTVLTGSMEPGIKPGDVVVDKGVTHISDLRIGDIITFLPYPDDPTLVTHRIVGKGVSGDGEISFVTQGDNNNAVDPWGPVLAKQIRGQHLFTVPKVGYVRQWAGDQTQVLIFGVAALLIGYGVVSFIVNSVRKGKKADGPAVGSPRRALVD